MAADQLTCWACGQPLEAVEPEDATSARWLKARVILTNLDGRERWVCEFREDCYEAAVTAAALLFGGFPA